MWFNPIMKSLLRSPLHPLVSKNIMLMTYTGRKSGKSYTTPMNYLSMEDALYTTSTRERVWWRNLRGGAEVTLRLHGKDVPARAESLEDPKEVARYIFRMFEVNPRLAKYMDIRIDLDGTPNLEDVARLAQERIMVRTVLK